MAKKKRKKWTPGAKLLTHTQNVKYFLAFGKKTEIDRKRNKIWNVCKKKKKSRKNMKIIVNNGFIYWLYLTYDNTTIKIINVYIFCKNLG